MSRRSESIYLRLPVPLQQVACTLQGWRVQRNRFGGTFGDLLRDAESRTHWDEERIRAFRDDRLRSFVRHAAKVPYYANLFDAHGIAADAVRSLDDLSILPVLDRATVQRSYGELIAPGAGRRATIPVHTSGTTGAGLRFVSTTAATREQWAVWWRYRGWHGICPGTWCGYFGGRSVVPVAQATPPFWRYNHPGRQILFSGYHLGPATVASYVDALRKRRPPWLHGYPSLLALLAGLILEGGLDLGYDVTWITTGAESLLPQQRRAIHRAFGVHPRQHYGLAEATANASECELGTLHIDEDFAAVEVVSDDGAPPRIVGTNFTNPAFVLLRYDGADRAELSEAPCPCGRPGRTLSALDGRVEDYVILTDGTRVGRLDHIFKDMVTIREAQIYQGRAGEMTLRVVRGEDYSDADELALVAETRKRVGNKAELSIEYVEHLQRSRAGKLRLVVSDVKEGKIERDETADGQRA